MSSDRKDTTPSKDVIPKTTTTTTTTTSSTSNAFFYDMFDVLDDPNEDDEANQHAHIEEEFSLGFVVDYTYNPMEEEEEMEEDRIHDNNPETTMEMFEEEEEEEDMVPTKSSSLSTTNEYEIVPSINGKRRRLPITTTTTTKKVRTSTDDNNEPDPMPEYLLAKKKRFDRMIQKSIETTTSSIDMEDLRQLAFFIHYSNSYQMLSDLWTVYLQAGTGQLSVDEDDTLLLERNQSEHGRYWPNHVLSLIVSKQDYKTLLPSNATEEDKQVTYEMVVDLRIRECNDRIEYYKKQFNEKKRHCIGFTPTLEEKIRFFVHQQGISYRQMKYKNTIAMLKYNYTDHLLQYQFQQEKPTPYQIQVAKELYDINVQLETAQCDYREFRERVLCNRPPVSLDGLQIALPSYMNPSLDRHQPLIHQYTTLIQQTKTDLMAAYLAITEVRIAQYQVQLKQATDQMYHNHNTRVPNSAMTKPLLRLILKRINTMKEKFNVKCGFRINDDLRSSYSHLKKVEKASHMKRIGFLPTMLIDRATHHLTRQQVRLLNRGPTYVAPCQLSISSSMPSMEDRLKQQQKPLLHKMALLFTEYNVAFSTDAEELKTKVKEEMKTFFSLPIPSPMYERACYEMKLIQSIRWTLKKNNLTLRRTADQNNLFYLGHRNDFHVKSNAYMQAHAENYTLLFTINDNNQKQVCRAMEKKVQLINSELKKLLQENRIYGKVYEKLIIKPENIKLPYLYFLPDVSTINSMQVKPMISAHRSATSKIANYLNRLLQPFVQRQMHRTLFVNETDFIQKLHSYANTEHHLRPTTLFATLQITNFHTMVSHKTMVEKLGNFLKQHLVINQLEYRSLKTTVQSQYISINTIQRLTNLFFDHTMFYYDGNMYKFTKGGPNSLVFSETLSNIYLCLWQQCIFEDPRLKNELYGRYKDQIFLSWNGSKDELVAFLKEIDETSRHIQFDIFVGRCVHFLNAQIENRQGQLYTRVYHPPTIQKYTLPYVVDRAQFYHRHWFRSGLMRAVRFCSNFNDFIQERIYLEMTCLANGYSIQFIETQLQHFYRYFNAEGIRWHLDQAVYEKLRDRLFCFIDRERTNLSIYQNLEADERVIHLMYFYQYGLEEKFNSKFRELWSKYLSEDPQLSNQKTNINLKSKRIYSLNALLAEQKPARRHHQHDR